MYKVLLKPFEEIKAMDGVFEDEDGDLDHKNWDAFASPQMEDMFGTVIEMKELPTQGDSKEESTYEWWIELDFIKEVISEG